MSCNFCLFFKFFCPKSIFFEIFKWDIIPMDFVSFPFRTSKFKNVISYIEYKFSHKFWKVCRWLNMYYSKIKIMTFFKVTTMSIWIILKNLIWICKECNFYRYWAIVACIYPLFLFYFCIWCSHLDVHLWLSMFFLFSFFTSHVHTWRCANAFLCFVCVFFPNVRIWRCVNGFLDLLFVFLSQCSRLEVCLCSKVQQRWGDLLPTTLCLLSFPSPLLESCSFLLFSMSLVICHLVLCYSLHLIELEVRTIVGLLSSLELLFYDSYIKLQGWGYIFKQLQLLVFCSIRTTISKL
jgi:hypothetical protein